MGKSLFSIFFPTPFCDILATKPSDLLNVGTATFRRSSGFSLKISLKWLWKKDTEQALRDKTYAMQFLPSLIPHPTSLLFEEENKGQT